MQKRSGIGIIGSVGIPNRYGGFESFVEQIAPELVSQGESVLVTCDKDVYSDDLSQIYNSVERIFIPISANGAASPFHDLLAFLTIAWKVDRILVLGVSGGLFFPLFRILSSFFGAAHFVVNIDGVEWQRGKFGLFQKFILYSFDRLSQSFAHGVIYDNQHLEQYVINGKRSVCIAYSGDHVLKDNLKTEGQVSDIEYALTICRIEPENNCEMLIQGFLDSGVQQYIFVGNWDASEYGRELRSKYANEQRLELRDPTYDKQELHALRNACSVYLHGHSVGGTNPSLVEIIFYDSPILCFDVPYHRATVGQCAGYFSNIEELSNMLSTDFSAFMKDRTELRKKYTSSGIANELIQFMNNIQAH